MQALLIAALAAGFTIAGGSLPLLRKDLPHRHLSWLVAFSAGIILSAGMLSMLGEAMEQLRGSTALLWAGVGFLTLYLLERITIIHSCHDEDCEREAGALVHAESGLAAGAGPAIALWGMGFHGMIDGFALAVATESHNLPLTLMVAVGVLLHSFPTGMSLAALMLYGGIRRRAAWRLLVLIASMAVVGAAFGLQLQNPMVLAWFGPAQAPPPGVLGASLAFSAGNFIYIATGDLLPEAHRNRSDYAVPFSVVAGFAVNIAAFLFFAHSP